MKLFKKDGKPKSEKQKEKKPKNKKHLIWKIPLCVLGAVLLVALVYVAYVFLSYSRIPDKQKITVEGKASSSVAQVGREYTAVTYNIGFCAYTPDFTFFMDGGKESRAKSEESVLKCCDGVADTALRENPDIVLYQEVDTDSTRSFHVDQSARLRKKYSGFCSAFAENYHSAYLMYPLTQPHGKSNSGILTLSNMKITSSLRRQLPIATDVAKIVDLDRCYSVSRIKTDNNKELVVYNVHASAYIKDPKILENQFKMIMKDMEGEYKKGNYVIIGGDFNHDFTGDSRKKLNKGGEEHAWATPFPDELLPEGFTKNTNYSDGKLTPTTRNCDIPYSKDSFVVILDGFITSDNIEVSYTKNIDTGFEYSDHNPVVIKFKLK